MLTIGEWEKRFIDFTSLSIALHYSTAMELGHSELHLFNFHLSCPSPLRAFTSFSLSTQTFLIIHLRYLFLPPLLFLSASSICLLSPFLPASPPFVLPFFSSHTPFPFSFQSQQWSPVTPTLPWQRRATWRSWTAQPGENGPSSSAGSEGTRSLTLTATPGTPLPQVPMRRQTRCCLHSR